MNKNLFILLIMLLTLVPIVEITRVVILYGQVYEFTVPLAWELIFYWVCYLGIIPLLYWKLKRNV